MVLGNRLRYIRESKGLSHRELAKLTGDSISFLMRVESGHAIPSMETIERWAKALGVGVDALFYEGKAPTLQNLTKRLNADDIAAASLRKTRDVPGKAS